MEFNKIKKTSKTIRQSTGFHTLMLLQIKEEEKSKTFYEPSVFKNRRVPTLLSESISFLVNKMLQEV